MSPSEELGELKHFLGLEVKRTKEGMVLEQQKICQGSYTEVWATLLQTYLHTCGSKCEATRG